jgi:hypothetical protein
MYCRTHFHQLRSKLAFECFEKYKNTSTRAMSRILFNELPEYFSSVEAARTYVNFYRGTSGKYNRDYVKNKKFFKNAV